jgi:CubicO group peptidase (beta-lactamase class C family)
MGGVAGHAGVFGTAADLARFALMVLGGGRFEGRWLVARETLDRFAAPCGVPGSSRGLGWDHPEGDHSSAGRLFSRSSIGHLGFTGTSIWIDRENRCFVILLSNSVHPVRGNEGLRDVRAALADAAATALRG